MDECVIDFNEQMMGFLEKAYLIFKTPSTTHQKEEASKELVWLMAKYFKLMDKD